MKRADEGGDDQLVDLQRVKDALGYGVKSVLRHKWLALFIVVALTAASAAFYEVSPRKYRARAVVQMTPNPNLQAMVNPRRIYSRNEGPSAEAALTSAMNQQFLLELIEKRDLITHWEQTRSPIQELRDALMAKVTDVPSPQEKQVSMLGTLEDRLTVSWKGDRAEISILWPDPKMAQLLVQDVQQHFLDLRRQQQTEGARAAIAVLEGAVAGASTEVGRAVAAIDAERARLRKGSKHSTVRGMQAEGRWKKMPQEELMKLRAEILSRRHTLSALEAQRSTRLAATESEVRELSTRYEDAHPALLDAKRRLQTLQQGSPELQSLREDEGRLLTQYVTLGGKELDLVDVSSRPTTSELEDGDPRLANARERLRLTTIKFTDLADRLETARLELAATESTFEEGFAVVRMATAPLKAEAPTSRKIIGVGFLAGLLLALFTSLFIDLRRGVLYDRWQVERAVGGRVLTEVERT